MSLLRQAADVTADAPMDEQLEALLEAEALRFRRSGLTSLAEWVELDLDERAALMDAHVEIQAEVASLAGWAGQSALQAAQIAQPWDDGEMLLDVAFAQMRQKLAGVA